MAFNYLCLDVASAPIVGAEVYLDPPQAPSNWKDEAKIAAYIAEKTAERLSTAALDLDLARITGIGMKGAGLRDAFICRGEGDERDALRELAQLIDGCALVTYNGFAFDLPLLMRRARYLGVDFPRLNLDRYRSEHLDLMRILSDGDPARRRSLGFYVRRLGWDDLTKPLTGAEESQVHESGRWEELSASLKHDTEAIWRLASWLGIIR